VPGATRRILDLIYTSGVEKPENFTQLCEEMYEQKTRLRVAKLLKARPELNYIRYVNGVQVKPIEIYLDNCPWDYINESSVASTKFHGDVQPENIIVKPNGDIVFIDWRDGFAGNTELGDMYYDLGKLWHDLIVSNQKILQKRYSISIEGECAYLSLELKSNLLKAMHIMKEYCLEKNIDWAKVEVLGALQYLTIACLYPDPEFSAFLFLLGKLCLAIHQGTEAIIENIKMNTYTLGAN
jgi:hypothetical protein